MNYKKNYFHRLHELTPTRFWINNPTIMEAQKAIEAGATGCTLNPSYTHKMYLAKDTQGFVLQQIQDVVKQRTTRDAVAAELQRRVAKPIQKAFYPIWEKSSGMEGYVSIQGDPVHEDDPEVIISEARENRSLGANIAVKIPATKAGLHAMEVLVSEDTPINATEIMSISQGIALCEMYNRVSSKSGKTPPLWLSFIAGIYDEYLMNYVTDNNVDIYPDIVRQAGMAATRKMYQILQEKGYPAVIIGGGARQLYHFTEMVGGNQVVTINWKGTAEILLADNPDVVNRFFNPVPNTVIDELLEKLVDFERGYNSQGLQIDQFETFGPVELFRSMFLESWCSILEIIDTNLS